jgi:predicted phosphodiesterase
VKEKTLFEREKTMKRLIIMSLVICLSTGVANAAMRKGPYMLYTGVNDEMMVLWQLDTTQACTLEWGEDTTYSSGSVQTAEFGADNQHEYVITNLTPGVKYYYRVTESVSHTGSFTAAPADVDVGNVKFMAYGDTRTQANRHDEVAGAMISAYTADPDFQTITLLSGDWTNNDSENDWTTQFFPRNWSNLLEFQANMPINGCIGNHEGAGNNFSKYWPYPYVSGFYWSFDYGPVHIAVVDQYHSGGYAPASTQYIWLEDDLSTTTKEWKIILLHQPGWGGGTHGNTTAVQNYIQPLCETYGVDFVIAGHNHNYVRAVVNGVQHITAGGGGAPLYAVNLGMPNVVAGESTHHFCTIDIQGYDLYFEAVRTNGTLIDSVLIEHTVPVPPGQATNPNPSDLATDIGINADLSWTIGTGAASHDVYFGTNATPGAGEFQGNQTGATFDPGVMSANTTYYWRIDEVNPVGTTTGNVWSFTTVPPIPPGQAGNPSPADLATDVDNNTDLNWSAGSGADSHDVYFGAVSPGVFQGNQAGTTFDPGTLAFNTGYYWRIDEVNPFGTTTGTVWSFTTQIAPPHSDNLTVTDGWSEKDEKTFVEDNKVSVFNSSDDDRFDLEKQYYISIYFSDISFTPSAVINSVTVYCEHWEEEGFSSGNLEFRVGTGWPGSPTTWATYSPAPEHFGEDNEAVDSWDVSSIVDTPAKVNQLEFYIENHDNDKKSLIDHAYVVVEWTEAPSAPGQAGNPSPVDLATDVSLTADLSWTAGSGATTHDVYFGTTSPGAFQGNQSGVTFDPGTMTDSTTYYWRIDEKSTGGTTTGIVWSFTTITPDTDPPTPNPATFASAPAADSDTAISMTATTGSDASGPVEYFFNEISGNPGGTDSGWQTSASYTDSGLTASTQYTYTVQMRDSVTPTPNVGAASSPANATTQAAPDTDPPTPNPATFAIVPAADSSSAISMAATTGSDVSGPVEYYFDETSGNPGGTDSGWQTSASYTDSGLNAYTQYTYTVQMRDSLLNTGTASTPANATTDAETDPPTPNPATFAVAPAADSDTAISMTATTGSDASGPVEYFFDETSGNPGGSDSGWQTSASYTDSGLTASTQYTYTVQMRDSAAPTPNVGTASSPASATTDATPDTTAPTPNPATFAVAPAAIGETAISMTATTGSDPSGPVEYYFNETSGNPGGTDSGWQTSASYTDSGLDDNTQYTYTVQMRDSATPTPNVGAASNPASATTDAETDPPTPNPATFAVAPAADSSSAISMTATTGSDDSGPVEYFFDETSGNPGGTDSGWQTSSSYTDSGLDADTQYTYTVQMRDALSNTGAASSPASATTNSGTTPYSQNIVVTDGWDSKNGKTFQDDGKVYVFTSSDDDCWDIEKNEYSSFEFSDISFGAGALITGVTVYCEHYEDSGFSSGNLEWNVGTGWPGGPTTWGTNTSVPTHDNDQTDSWDVTSYVNSTTRVNDLEFRIKNNDNDEKTKPDYIYVTVEWTE